MFYLNRNVQTEVFFTHYDMNLSVNEGEIFKRLNNKTDNFCSKDFGLVIQVMEVSKGSQIIIEKVRIAPEGCYAKVKFSFVSFKPQKDEILSIIISSISQHFITGKIGNVEVRILRNKSQSNVYIYENEQKNYCMRNEQTGEQRRLYIGGMIWCRCFEVKIQMNNLLYIIAKLDKSLIDAMFKKLSNPEFQ